MYSVVLMAAITAGTASQDCCFAGFCNWCGHGGYATTCYGGCHGCYGCTGCYGCSCYGCSCYGGCHGVVYSSCYGCTGCYGCSGVVYYSSCYGCTGCHGCSGVVVTPYQPVPMAPVMDKKVEPLPPPVKKTGDQVRAKVVIDVPAEATLYIDNQQMPSKAGQRTFVTPELRAGQTYFYDIKIVVNQGGQQQVQTSRVVLRPGEVVAATFNTQNTGTVVASPRP